jgi:hypothetical protein
MYLLNITVNCSFLFIRFVNLHGKLLSVLTPALHVPFWKHERPASDLWNWCLIHVLMLFTDEFCFRVLFLAMKFSNDSSVSNHMEEVQSVWLLLWHLKDLEGIGHWVWQLALFHRKVVHISGRDNGLAHWAVISLNIWSCIITTTILTPVLCCGCVV